MSNEQKHMSITERNLLLKKRLEILEQIVKLNNKYREIDQQLPQRMSHSANCSGVEDQLKYLTARTAFYLEEGSEPM